MNSKQRREIRRFVSNNLYKLAYERDYEGCMEFDLYPSNAKMYIDYPAENQGSFIYARIPNFHLINRRSRDVGIEGAFTVKLSKSPRINSFREITSLVELTPFSEDYIEALHHARYPQYILPVNEDRSYIIKEHYSGMIRVYKYSDGGEESLKIEKAISLEDLLSDTDISKKIRTELAFNIDLFERDRKNG